MAEQGERHKEALRTLTVKRLTLMEETIKDVPRSAVPVDTVMNIIITKWQLREERFVDQPDWKTRAALVDEVLAWYGNDLSEENKKMLLVRQADWLKK